MTLHVVAPDRESQGLERSLTFDAEIFADHENIQCIPFIILL